MRQLALLVALVDQQSLSLAASRLGLTPSAASQSLQRLRQTFGDELVVRQKAAYLLTPLGEEVIGSLREMVHLWQEATSGAAFFDPASSEMRMCIACAEGIADVELDAGYADIVTRAPHISLDLQTPDMESGGYEGLRSATVDILLTSLAPAADAADLHAERLADAVFTHCCLSVSHPRIGDALSLSQYLAEHHLLAPTTVREGRELQTSIDRWLVSNGFQARMRSSIHPLSRMAYVLSTTDRLATVSLRHGVVLRRHAEGLRLLSLPPEMPQLPTPRYMVWHHRTHGSPAHRWLRDRLREYVDIEDDPPR